MHCGGTRVKYPVCFSPNKFYSGGDLHVKDERDKSQVAAPPPPTPLRAERRYQAERCSEEHDC